MTEIIYPEAGAVEAQPSHLLPAQTRFRRSETPLAAQPMEERMMRQAMLAVAVVLMATATARAQDKLADKMVQDALSPDTMQVAVVGYGKIPPGAGFQTELVENSEISTHVDESLKSTLARHGLHYSPDATLVFSVGADRTGNNAAAYAADNIARDNSQVHITIDTSDTKLTATIPHTFRISLALYNRQSGQYVWRGEVTEQRPDADPFDATDPMLERLAAALDKSIGAAN